MADNIRRIPERFGAVQAVWHPRITSVGRRLLACLSPGLLGVICLGVLWMRRPAPAISVVIVAVILGCVVACWLRLRPHTVAVTHTHVLGSRLVGFHQVRRDAVAGAVVVESLEKPGRISRQGAKAPKRGFARPMLWFVDEAQRPVLRLDGNVWDLRSLDELTDYVGVRTHRYHRVEPQELAQSWPKTVTVLMRYPWITSVLTGFTLVAVVAAVYWLAWNG